MRIVLATVRIPFLYGGAESHAEELRQALIRAGHEADIINIPFKWYPPERILDHMLACRLLDVSEFSGVTVDRMIGLKFPAYHIPHKNKILWILHQHRQAYDLWDDPVASDMRHQAQGALVRSAIMEADRKLIPEAKAVFANSRNVAARLNRYCGIQAQPLYHPPPGAERFYSGSPEPYIFFPSRVSRLKRQTLAIQALAVTRHPVRLRIAGVPDNPAELVELKRLADKLRVSSRLEWLDWISEEEKVQQYAHALAVLYPVADEDYGYVTLEAMLASKAVIACRDSGGATEFVAHDETGWLTDPSPEAVAQAMDAAWDDRARAASLGKCGRERYESFGISWENVVRALVG